ncbi:MAG: helix-hairpin-helix domain-containing protein [Candidatus Omnitrophota bacterium]
MDNQNKKINAVKDLQSLHNIGPAIAERLYSIGITTARQMKQSNPEKTYEELKKKEGGKLDKCVLYVLRGAILDIPWCKCKDF